MTRHTIAIVEDEKNLQQLLASYFQREGFLVQCFHDYPSARAQCENATIDAWILDIMLPQGDGRDLLAAIRAYNQAIPVICLSARDSEYDRIQGLELGSDDYITKPFSPREVLLRMKRLLVRAYGEEVKAVTYEIGAYVVDLEKEAVFFEQEKVELTYREFQLLVYLLKQRQRPVTREQLLNELWGLDYVGSDRVVDDLIRRLRKKMPTLELVTIYGQGYRLS
ncbi:MAG: response regulator transcription factor [Culicoidibacterales bacterium]